MNKKIYYVDYGGIKIPFWELANGILDRCIVNNWPIGLDREIFSQLFRPGEICLDIGSYIGTHAISMALLGGLVYAFEPSPCNYPRLVAHCSLFPQIRCFNVGFNDKSYEVETRFRDCNSQETFAPGADPVQLIKYCNIMDFIKENNLSLPCFIKMDIEGMESIVLNTMKDLIKNQRPRFLIELHWSNDHVQEYEHCPTWREKEDGGFDFNYFFEVGYSVYKYDGRDSSKLTNIETCKGLPSLICIPSEQCNEKL